MNWRWAGSIPESGGPGKEALVFIPPSTQSRGSQGNLVNFEHNPICGSSFHLDYLLVVDMICCQAPQPAMTEISFYCAICGESLCAEPQSAGGFCECPRCLRIIP